MPRVIDVENMSAHQLMKAMSRLERKPERIPGSVRKTLEEADAKATGRDVTVLLPKLKIRDNQEAGFFTDLGAEVYVVGLALDLTGEGQVMEQAGEIFHNVSRTASAPLTVSSTPLFNNIYDGDLLPLLGNGVVLYGPKDPGGLLDIHVAIMENDGGYRETGQLIEAAAKEVDLPGILEGALKAVSLAKPEVFLARNAFRLMFHTLLTMLQNEHDDVIQDFHFSSLKHQRYLPGVHPFAYRGAEGFIRVDVSQ